MKKIYLIWDGTDAWDWIYTRLWYIDSLDDLSIRLRAYYKENWYEYLKHTIKWNKISVIVFDDFTQEAETSTLTLFSLDKLSF